MAEFDKGLLNYFAARQRQRDERVARTFNHLSIREQRLVREAAVMGYVQGVRSQPGGCTAEIPKDAVIVYQVVDGCLAFDDLYPQINRVERSAVRRAREVAECPATPPAIAPGEAGAG